MTDKRALAILLIKKYSKIPEAKVFCFDDMSKQLLGFKFITDTNIHEVYVDFDILYSCKHINALCMKVKERHISVPKEIMAVQMRSSIVLQKLNDNLSVQLVPVSTTMFKTEYTDMAAQYKQVQPVELCQKVRLGSFLEIQNFSPDHLAEMIAVEMEKECKKRANGKTKTIWLAKPPEILVYQHFDNVLVCCWMTAYFEEK